MTYDDRRLKSSGGRVSAGRADARRVESGVGFLGRVEESPTTLTPDGESGGTL